MKRLVFFSLSWNVAYIRNEKKTTAFKVSFHKADGRYEFTDVLPGHYEVLIDTDVFCWKSPSHRISITSEHAEVPPFKQTGLSVTFISSHATEVEFFEPSKSKKITLELPLGSSRHCVSRPGEYKFVPKGCHVYPKDSYDWDTNSLSPIILSSTEHSHRAKIASAALLDDVKAKIESGGETKVLGPLRSAKVGNVYHYYIDFVAATDNTYVITPMSDILLFSPASAKVVGVNDCHTDVTTFLGELGKVSQHRESLCERPPVNFTFIQFYEIILLHNFNRTIGNQIIKTSGSLLCMIIESIDPFLCRS